MTYTENMSSRILFVSFIRPDLADNDAPKAIRFQGNTFGDLKNRLLEAKMPGYTAESFVEVKDGADGPYICFLDQEALPQGDVYVSVHAPYSGPVWQKPMKFRYNSDCPGRGFPALPMGSVGPFFKHLPPGMFFGFPPRHGPHSPPGPHGCQDHPGQFWHRGHHGFGGKHCDSDAEDKLHRKFMKKLKKHGRSLSPRGRRCCGRHHPCDGQLHSDDAHPRHQYHGHHHHHHHHAEERKGCKPGSMPNCDPVGHPDAAEQAFSSMKGAEDGPAGPSAFQEAPEEDFAEQFEQLDVASGKFF